MVYAQQLDYGNSEVRALFILLLAFTIFASWTVIIWMLGTRHGAGMSIVSEITRAFNGVADDVRSQRSSGSGRHHHRTTTTYEESRVRAHWPPNPRHPKADVAAVIQALPRDPSDTDGRGIMAAVN
ncbi:MAG: hypothetical protein QOE03_4197 [Micromonosporaceae bacterium]|jgi:hypothetical protein|nr:hypothetical protein [Micromonosporaceae bacterium]